MRLPPVDAKVIDHPHLIRRADSGGIVNTDTEGLAKYREERQKQLALNRIMQEHQQLKDDVASMKSMLEALLEHIRK
jgi:hypothetical protein